MGIGIGMSEACIDFGDIHNNDDVESEAITDLHSHPFLDETALYPQEILECSANERFVGFGFSSSVKVRRYEIIDDGRSTGSVFFWLGHIGRHGAGSFLHHNCWDLIFLISYLFYWKGWLCKCGWLVGDEMIVFLLFF
jgi:hypothetical protein